MNSLMKIYLAVFTALALYVSNVTAETIAFNNPNSGVTLLDQDRSGLTLSMNIGAIDINAISVREGTFAVLAIDGFSHSQKVGEPNLPVISKVVAIPFGCELRVNVVDFDVEELNLADYNIFAPVIPVQPSLSKSQNPSDVDFEYNRGFLEKRT